MSARCGALLVTVAAVCLALLPAPAHGLVTYDDFNSGELDLGEPPIGGRWLTYEYVTPVATSGGSGGGALGPSAFTSNQRENPLRRHPSFSTSNTAARRRIVGGQLQVQLDSVGGAHPDLNVVPGQGRIGVTGTSRPFTQSRNVVQVTVTPMSAVARACAGADDSRVRAQLIATVLDNYYFGFIPQPVFATLSLERSGLGGDRIHAVVSRCVGDFSCALIEEIASVVFSRTWTLGTAHMLTIIHEPENDRVVFNVSGGGAAAERRVLRYPPPRPGAVAWDFDLRVETTPANCPETAPAERGRASMDARFDDVRVGDR